MIIYLQASLSTSPVHPNLYMIHYMSLHIPIAYKATDITTLVPQEPPLSNSRPQTGHF